MKAIILLTALLFFQVKSMAQLKETKCAQSIINESGFQTCFKKRVEYFFSNDTAYRFYNPRPVLIFFTITKQGSIDSFFCIGQVKLVYINAYRSILDSVLKTVTPGFIKEHIGFTMFQMLLEVGTPADISAYAEAPDIEYGGGYTSHSKEYIPRQPFPLFGFNAGYGYDKSYQAYQLSRKKEIKMFTPLMIYINKQGVVQNITKKP